MVILTRGRAQMGGGPADVPRATGRQWARACGIGEEGRGAQLLGPALVGQHLRRGVVDGMLPHTPLYTHAQWARSTRKPALLPAHTSRHVPVVTDASWRLPRGRRRSVGRATQGRGAEQNKAMKPGLCQNDMVTPSTAMACGGCVLQHAGGLQPWTPRSQGMEGKSPSNSATGCSSTRVGLPSHGANWSNQPI